MQGTAGGGDVLLETLAHLVGVETVAPRFRSSTASMNSPGLSTFLFLAGVEPVQPPTWRVFSPSAQVQRGTQRQQARHRVTDRRAIGDVASERGGPERIGGDPKRRSTSAKSG